MIRITDDGQYGLPGTQDRFIHLATIERQTGLGGIRTFLYFHDRVTNKRYLEEISGAHLSQIMNDALFEELNQFIVSKKLDQIIITPNHEYLTQLPSSVKHRA